MQHKLRLCQSMRLLTSRLLSLFKKIELPLLANPKYVLSSNYFGRHVWKKSGENVILTCPIMVGALRQAYHVQWHIKQENPRYTIETTDHYTSLTITNIKSEDYRPYVCSVSVINPIDKQHWVHFQRVYLSKGNCTVILFCQLF